MARSVASFVCQSCGAAHSKWSGRCDACGAWNTLAEEAAAGDGHRGSLVGASGKKARKLEVVSLAGESEEMPRLITGVDEFDRVCGGGLVPGSAVLVGGDPGIGKSTILLQACASLARQGRKVVYVSGEEAIAQIRLRATRLGLADAPVDLISETNLRDILAGIGSGGEQAMPDVVVIDSIQTMWSDALESAPGTVAQVRASTQELVRFAKKRNTVVLLVGHVTKDGQIAGPRVMEHMVDAVLYFEGDRGHQFRILRAVKNRFGATDEIGVFEMTDAGLAEVANPSELFLSGRDTKASGAAVFAGIEGSRPVLVEIQALVSQSSLGTPRRAVVGWDSGRLAMVLAVLEARCGIGFGGQDVYLNVAGGLRVTEPAADLAVAAALISSAFDAPLPADCVIFGEISLSGSVRPVGQSDARLKESQKLGFKSVVMPSSLPGKGAVKTKGLGVREIDALLQLVDHLRPDS